MSNVPFAREVGVRGCRLCGLVCEYLPPPSPAGCCPRCHSELAASQSQNLYGCWALLLAAMIFYLPANVLPVMYTSLFGRGSESTILSGVIEFWRSGSYAIAAVIFIASVAIPCMKFLSLSVLLVAAGRKSRWARRERTRLYRITEWIGCWSMLDVVVVAAVCGLVRFHSLSEAEPRPGILFFALVVILTMLSALSFEPKLIWEGDE
ncbi:paraquat-inducible protein A [Erwinia typographi]|uniref:Paraquat-inducible protein A n=1 Tax=Erwinia typographi TaxID=371042 RepID=A0A0A3Z1R2_9GAMM|nr:paraquat-inducible protein A [Erwinia typographi]KGT92997.1 paraquat-inducible protein A [Erwinia typographi]